MQSQMNETDLRKKIETFADILEQRHLYSETDMIIILVHTLLESSQILCHHKLINLPHRYKIRIPQNAVSCLPALCHEIVLTIPKKQELNLTQLCKICIQLAPTRCKHVALIVPEKWR